jgi:hypothetical protein
MLENLTEDHDANSQLAPHSDQTRDGYCFAPKPYHSLLVSIQAGTLKNFTAWLIDV